MKRIWLHGSLEGAWKLASILTSSMPVVLLSRLFVASPLWFMHSSNVSWLPGDIWCLSQGALSLEGAGRGQAGGSSDKHHDGESRGPLKTELGRGVDQIEIGKEEVTFLAQRKANSEACNALVCAKHRNPLISWCPVLRCHGKGWYPGLGPWLSTGPESPHVSRAAGVPSTRCLSFSGAVEGLFLPSTDSPSPNPPRRQCSMKAVLFGVGPPTERRGNTHGPRIPCRKQFNRALTLDPAFWSL